MRTVIVGIDGLDAECLSRNLKYLPTFSRVAEKSGIQSVKSVFPPDSDSAWATIYTGLSPAQHGILHMENPLIKTARLASTIPPNVGILGRTFWDRAAKRGLRCAVIFPHLGYPAWPVNGLMISRSPVRDEFSIAGSLPRQDLLRPEHLALRSLPRHGRESEYLDEAFARVAAEGDLFVELLDADEWDLFFVYSSFLDLLEHFFWAPAGSFGGPDGGEYVRLAYRAYDDLLRGLVGNLRADDRLFVISDHGHGPRPPNEFGLVAYLRSDLYGGTSDLHDPMPRLSHSPAQWPRILLRLLPRLMEHVDIRDLSHQLLRRFPWLGSALARLDSPGGASQISLVLASPIKSYSYGGVNIRKGRGRNLSSPPSVSSVIESLREVSDPDGHPLFEWVAPRADVDAGTFLSQLPDILFQLREDYVATEGNTRPFIGPHQASNLVPGSHRRKTATFMYDGPSLHDASPVNLEEVHDAILRSLFTSPEMETGSPA